MGKTFQIQTRTVQPSSTARSVLYFCFLGLLLGVQEITCAAFTRYDLTTNGGLNGFNTATSNAPVTIDFDTIADGTDVSGTVVQDVNFNVPSQGAAFIVVRGNDTFTPTGFTGVLNAATNKLFPTSGEMVLSPGGLSLGPGPNNPVENDDLELVFSNSVKAFGFDVLFQSADTFSATTIQVFNQANVQLFSGSIPASTTGGGGAPAEAVFWGGVASGSDRISRIVVNESDSNAQFPDCNIGFDSFRIVTDSGDFNHDGIVDAADYVVWRKTDGTPAGYNIWRANFGQPSGSGSVASANATVPEPTALVMLIVAALSVTTRRLRTWRVSYLNSA